MRRVRSLGSRSVLTLALVCGALASGDPAARAAPGDAGAIAGGDLIRMLAGDQAATLSGLRVEGDLNLAALQNVRRPLRCQSCRFTGRITGTDLIFERIVDFNGSVFEGPVDLSAVLFRDRAGFEGVTFSGPVTFGSTRFLADASFAGTQFQGAAVFDRVQFSGGALFSDAVFASDAGFQATQFGSGADFAGADFEAAAIFASAGFGKKVSFARSNFAGAAEFRGAVLSGGANLGVERFDQGVSLEAVTAAGSVEFLGAALQGEGVFNNFASTGLLALDGIRVLGSNSGLFLDQISVSRLTMDVDQIEVVQGRNVQKTVLKLVEKSGRESGDLALANRARFQLLDLEGEEKEGFWRWWDRLVFRDISGYLVRPIHPLVTLAILLLAGAMIRSAGSLRLGFMSWWRSRSSTPEPPTLRGKLRAWLLLGEKGVSRVLEGLSRTLNVAIRRKAEIKLENRERVRDYLMAGLLWGEFLLYKLVFAIFVLALGNSNSTVRQLLDAVTG
ncbi:MAG TPA: pentapeptide repeat-containing protein [Actinomycetota bacterium]|nr:pentapeptide repeat-containing protein [Actinomycetota bacterium]